MHAQHLLSDEDFDLAMSKSLSERPDRHQRLVATGFKTPSTICKERRDNNVVLDQREEDRRRRKDRK